MMAFMTTGRDKDDTLTTDTRSGTRPAVRLGPEELKRPVPPAMRPQPQPEPPPTIYVEIRTERTSTLTATGAPQTERRILLAATGAMEDIAPSLHSIARKFRPPWWHVWRKKTRDI
jgi:hypothetical protein